MITVHTAAWGRLPRYGRSPTAHRPATARSNDTTDSAASSTNISKSHDVCGFRAPTVPAPIQAGRRWPVERTHSWMNGYGKLRRCTDKRRVIVESYLYLAAALTVIRRLINQARSRYRWPTRPTTRRLR